MLAISIRGDNLNIYKKLKDSFKKMNFKNIAIITTSLMICIFILLPITVKANFLSDPMGSIGKMISEGISWLIIIFGKGIESIATLMGGSIDKLVFNIPKGKSMTYGYVNLKTSIDLSLIRGNALSNSMFSIYKTMQILGTCVISVSCIWITVDISRAGEDTKRKAQMKDRLTRLIITFFMMTSLPVFMDILLVINAVIVDIFRSLVTDLPMFTNLKFDKPFLMSTFLDLAKKAADGEIVYATMYLFSGFMNIWLIIFYMIRDLTISFLFMIAPIMICLFPFKTDMLMKWAKEMVSNIFTQSIQAFVLYVILAIASGLSPTSTTGLYDSIFALVSFALFIPLTTNIKKILGLEGEFGAAKSNAGLGAVMGAAMIGGMALKGAKGAYSGYKETNTQMNELKAERESVISGKSGTEQLSNSNSKMSGGTGSASPRSLDAINGDMKNLKRQRNNKLASSLVGSTMGGLGALGASVYGTPMASMAMASMGGAIGSVGGEIGSDVGHGVTGFASEKVQDGIFGQGMRSAGLTDGTKRWNANTFKGNMKQIASNAQRIGKDVAFGVGNEKNTTTVDANGNEVTRERSFTEAVSERREGLADKQDDMLGMSESMRNSDMYKDEKSGLLKAKELTRRGNFAKASLVGIRDTAPMKGEQGIEDVNGEQIDTGLLMEQNEKESLLFRQNENGTRNIISRGQGHGDSTKGTILQKVTLNDNADDSTITNDNLPNMQDSALQSARDMYGQDLQIDLDRGIVGRDNGDGIVRDSGATQHYQSNLTKQIEDQVSQVVSMRQATGANNLNIGSSMSYERDYSVEQQVAQVNLALDVNQQPVTTREFVAEKTKGYGDDISSMNLGDQINYVNMSASLDSSLSELNYMRESMLGSLAD